MLYHCSCHPWKAKRSIYSIHVISSYLCHLHKICDCIYCSNSVWRTRFYDAYNEKTAIWSHVSNGWILPLMLSRKIQFYEIFCWTKLLSMKYFIYITFVKQLRSFVMSYIWCVIVAVISHDYGNTIEKNIPMEKKMQFVMEWLIHNQDALFLSLRWWNNFVFAVLCNIGRLLPANQYSSYSSLQMQNLCPWYIFCILFFVFNWVNIPIIFIWPVKCLTGF